MSKITMGTMVAHCLQYANSQKTRSLQNVQAQNNTKIRIGNLPTSMRNSHKKDHVECRETQALEK